MLRQDFWVAIDRYMEELECPKDYFSQEGPWRNDKDRRSRVMYWLLSCAISDAFGDVEDGIHGSATVEDATKIDPAVFPLGFTTEDPEIDEVLTKIRMKHLVRLRSEQDRINEIIATLQKTTVEKSKPLKSRKR